MSQRSLSTNTPNLPSPKPKETITYRTLPRELRQDILDHSNTLCLTIDNLNNPFTAEFTEKSIQLTIAKRIGGLEVKRFEAWVKVLDETLTSENRQLREDIEYVSEMWRKEIDEIMNKSCQGLGWLVLGERYYAWVKEDGRD